MTDTWTIKIDGVDRTSLVDVQTISVTKTQGFRRDTASFAINSQFPTFTVFGTWGTHTRTLALAFRNWQTVEIWRNDTLEFGGFVMIYDGQDAGTYQDNTITCVDWSALLDARITDGERTFTSQTAGQIVTTLMTEFVPEINVSLVAPGETVGEITYNYAIMSDVLRELAQSSGFIYYVKVNNSGAPFLYFMQPTNPVAPFALSTTPNEPASYSFRVDNWATEGTEVRNAVTVQYADGTVTRSDAASQTLYGYELAMMREAETADATLATIIADGILEAYADEIQNGSVTCWTGGLSAGMLIHVTHVPLGIDDDYIIQEITLTPDGEKTIYALTLGDKHTGLIDRLRELGGMGGGITSGGNVTGKLYVGRREGPHVGMFRTRRPDLDYNIYLQAVDTGNQPFFSIGAIDYATNGQWLQIGYVDPATGKAPIRMAVSTTLDPAPEAHPALEIDAAYLTGSFPTSLTYLTTRAVTDTTTEVAGDDLIVCDKATAMTVNLLAATGTGRVIIVKSIGAGIVTVDPASSETIDGGTTAALNQYDAVQLVDYASGKWVIV